MDWSSKEAVNAYKREWKRRNIDKVRRYQREYQRRWREKNPDKVQACPSRAREYQYTKRLLDRYGLTRDAYEALLDEQGSACALCRQPFTPTGDARPVVDHCHETNIVRGILCNGCNVGLGKIGDTVEAI